MMKTFRLSNWLAVSLFNLVVVAALGTVMRYKIGFDFPYFTQKYLQHAHSHFAFAGWITQTLMVLMVQFLKPSLGPLQIRNYNIILSVNLFVAIGMLISFLMQGYDVASIFFSTSSIFISYAFAFVYWKDLNRGNIQHPSIPWFKASIVFLVLSSAGTFYLAYMMAANHLPMNRYLSSVYFYLHFQYNGWFFFAIIGLFIAHVLNIAALFRPSIQVFRLFFISCFPAFFLSVLWLKLPTGLYWVVVVSALAQVLGWTGLMRSVWKVRQKLIEDTDKSSLLLLFLIALSLSVKFALQAGSLVPAVSQLAFGFRTIIIAYLHLVLLGIVSMYLLTHLKMYTSPGHSRRFTLALLVFGAGVYVQEIILGIQGIASFSYTLIPYANLILLFMAIWLLIGAVLLFLSFFRKNQQIF
jgi:hypothetical protein